MNVTPTSIFNCHVESVPVLHSALRVNTSLVEDFSSKCLKRFNQVGVVVCKGRATKLFMLLVLIIEANDPFRNFWIWIKMSEILISWTEHKKKCHTFLQGLCYSLVFLEIFSTHLTLQCP